MGKEQQDYGVLLHRAGKLVGHLDALVSGIRGGDYVVKDVRFKCNSDPSGQVLLIIKAEREGVMYVGFHKDVDLLTCFSTGVQRLLDQSIRWREDIPFGG